MASVNPAPRRRWSRVRRLAVVLSAASLAVVIIVAAMITLSTDETRRLCDSAVADGVAATAAARSAIADADAALHAERRDAADHEGAQGPGLGQDVRERRDRLREAAWVPRCTTREDVEVVRSQSHAAHRSTAALDRAVVALRTAHPAGSR